MPGFEALHRAVAEIQSHRLVFVGGSAKSGTTWMQLALDSHPDIACRGEGHLLNLLAPQLQKGLAAYNGTISQKNDLVFGALGGFPVFSEEQRDYLVVAAAGLLLAEVKQGRSVSLVGEKTPDNVAYFARLLKLFPRSNFIHVVRDGRDAAVSGYFHNLILSKAKGTSFSHSLDGFATWFAAYWAQVIEAGERFASEHPARIITVRYEDMVSHGRESLARIFEFLGVEAGPAVVDLCVAATTFEKLSGGRRPGEEDRDSFFRNGMTGDWKTQLATETVNHFEVTAGKALQRFGYA